MKTKTTYAKRYHTVIRTRHVFIEDEQVFLKEVADETYANEMNVPEWFPTKFNWIPASL